MLCCNDYFSSVCLGNIVNESLSTIWNKPEYKRLRKKLGTGVFELDLCKKCRGW